MRAAAEHRYGARGLAGRTVGVEGVGKVGARLVALLASAGVERIVVADPNAAAVERLTSTLEQVRTAPTVIDADVDVYAPGALGATLTHETVRDVRASIVCGAANNQLETSDVAGDLQARGILWVPDYVANAGGVVQVGGELYGRSHEEVQAKIEAIAATTTEVITAAEGRGVTTAEAADTVVESRLAARRAELAR
jgi:valine dehydrogenase (NAD+)